MGEHRGMSSTTGAVAVFGAVSGVALVLDIAIITLTNSHIEPLDSILFFIGLGAMLVTLVALAVHVGSGPEGRTRVGSSVIAFVAILVVGGTISFVSDAVGRRVFPPSNIGLHGEWSFFSLAVCLLALSVWATRRLRAAGPPTA